MRRNLVVLSLLSLIASGSCKRSETVQTPANTQQQTSVNQSATTLAATPATPGSPQVVAPNAPPVASSNASQVKPKTDACALLTSKEIELVQGEPLKETKLSGTAEGGFVVSQCFYTLPTFTNSISLSVTQKGEAVGARDPKEFWRETFKRGEEREKEREREKRGGEKGRDREKEREKERELQKAQGRGEEEEESAPPKKVPGIGDEAFWMGSRVGGALYVLKGNSYVRVSVGGAGDEASKIRKTKALAQKAIVRL
jgi:hypothetical protein